MAEKLSDFIVKNAPRPDGERPYLISYDTEVKGFGVRVTRAGARAFILNYRAKGGTERRWTIGAFPDWSTTAAREEAKRLKRLVDQGGDPMRDRHEDRTAPTVGELCGRYLEEHASRKREGSRREDEGLIRQWVRPELGAMKVKDVEHEDIERLHRKITKGGTPYRANRVAALLGKMFALAVKWKLRANNPVAGLEKNPEAKRTRYMTHEEVARLSAALAAHRNQEGANVIRLLLLTGARRGEVMKAQWSQFDLAAGVWTKPGATTKQKTEHRVPLSGPALQLLVRMREDADAGDERAAELEEAAAEERRPKTAAAKRRAAAQWRERKASPYLFPGDVPGEPVNNIRRFWEDIVERAELQNVRIHDLRHSYASFLASAGHSLPIIGALLGHTQAQTTQRYAHLLDDPLRQATERVGAIVAAATAGTTAKVLPLKRVR